MNEENNLIDNLDKNCSVSVSREKLQSPKGTHDILPDEYCYFELVRNTVEKCCKEFGFGRISTPIFENKELFQRSVGAISDIVEKELYVFKTASGKEYALKPEGTAGVVRAYIQHGMSSWPQPVQLYYIEPHFRHDRPQAGRFRQFHQFGFEVIGEIDPVLDAQIIQLANQINSDLKISNHLKLQINSLGCAECRPKYIVALKDFYFGKERSLCDSCNNRLEKNPLRLLDCKAEDCQLLSFLAPKISNFWCGECASHFTQVKEFLTELKIPFVENLSLVRGLDYYTRTVFEFWDEKDGAQNAIGGGGRYDKLIADLGGVDVPALGYAAGIERIIAHMKTAEIKIPHDQNMQIFVAPLGVEAKKKALKLLEDLRKAGIRASGALGKNSMKSQMKLADRFGASLAIIFGQIEIQDGTIIIRDMKKGSQEIVLFKDIVKIIKNKLKK